MLKKKAIYLILISILLSSCSNFNKLLRSNNSEEKLTIADQYFAKGNYYKASLLYESMLEGLKYNPDVERIYFQVGECSYYLGDFYTAGFHYKSYFEYFPQGKYSEVARFRHAICGYRESLSYNLDPTYTKKSIENLQLFINYFPKSIYVDSCNYFMDLSRVKLEQKAYENAFLYYNIQNYKSAITAFKNFSKDFPETNKHSEAAFYIVKCSYLLAENSVDAKKKERLTNVIFEFNELEYELKNSEFYQDSKKIKEKAVKLMVSREFEIAYSFYKKQNYDAALNSFKSFSSEYPSSSEHAQSVLYVLKSSYLKAKNSNDEVKKVMYQNVVEDFLNYQNDLINTSYYEDALEIKNDTERQIEKLSKK